MVGMNTVLVAINAWFIVRLLRDRHDETAFEVLEVGPADEYLRHMLRVHGADILKFNPTSSTTPSDDQDAFLVQKGDETVGVVLLREEGETADVLLDYVTPRYRDFSPGEFVWRKQRPARRPRDPPRGDTARDGRRLLRPARLPRDGRLLRARALDPEFAAHSLHGTGRIGVDTHHGGPDAAPLQSRARRRRQRLGLGSLRLRHRCRRPVMSSSTRARAAWRRRRSPTCARSRRCESSAARRVTPDSPGWTSGWTHPAASEISTWNSGGIRIIKNPNGCLVQWQRHLLVGPQARRAAARRATWTANGSPSVGKDRILRLCDLERAHRRLRARCGRHRRHYRGRRGRGDRWTSTPSL